jgi:hypothetical protein
MSFSTAPTSSAHRRHRGCTTLDDAAETRRDGADRGRPRCKSRARSTSNLGQPSPQDDPLCCWKRVPSQWHSAGNGSTHMFVCPFVQHLWTIIGVRCTAMLHVADVGPCPLPAPLLPPKFRVFSQAFVLLATLETPERCGFENPKALTGSCP